MKKILFVTGFLISVACDSIELPTENGTAEKESTAPASETQKKLTECLWVQQRTNPLVTIGTCSSDGSTEMTVDLTNQSSDTGSLNVERKITDTSTDLTWTFDANTFLLTVDLNPLHGAVAEILIKIANSSKENSSAAVVPATRSGILAVIKDRSDTPECGYLIEIAAGESDAGALLEIDEFPEEWRTNDAEVQINYDILLKKPKCPLATMAGRAVVSAREAKSEGEAGTCDQARQDVATILASLNAEPKVCVTDDDCVAFDLDPVDICHGPRFTSKSSFAKHKDSHTSARNDVVNLCEISSKPCASDAPHQPYCQAGQCAGK